MKTKTRSISISSPFVADDLSALDSEQTLVLVFGPSQMLDDSNLISSVADAFPHSHLIGCSTSGEIVGTTISDNTLAIGVCRFSDSELKTTVAPVASSADSFGAGEMIARELAGPSLRSVFVLSDGLNVNGSELVRGLNSVLPEEVVVTGGLAGDGDRFVRTWVLSGGRPMSGHVCAVGLSGDRLLVGHGSKGGWDIFGPERRVTRSKGNILYELDGKPALEIYKQYLGDRASGLPSTALRFPLALRYDKDAEKQVVRTILGVDEDSQAMVFAGDVPEGCFAQLMYANIDRLIDGASRAALMTRSNSPTVSGDTLAIAISCVGRRMVLGGRTEEELESAAEILPKGSRQIGFYSYGEISPYSTGYCDLHNQTMTLTTIGER